MFGYVKAGAAVPKLHLADCVYNKEEILKSIKNAAAKGIRILAFPELCITGYSCADLFFQKPLLAAAEKAVQEIAAETADLELLFALGVPIPADNRIFNCAVVLYRGKILGAVPKTFIPNYSEFYEDRWFAGANDLLSETVSFAGQDVPIGNDILFAADGFPGLQIGIEICEDLWTPIPPSSYQCLYGATLILNLSASNELAAKSAYRRQLVSQQSSRCLSAYVYSSAGIGESTQDTVFSGHSLIYEIGTNLAETKLFQRESQLAFADIDIDLILHERRKHSTFMAHLQQPEAQRFYRQISFAMEESPLESSEWKRPLSPAPFLPPQDSSLDARCQAIFGIQVTGLARRMEHTHANTLVIGISGGLDSTLALLVSAKACDFLGLDRSHVLGVTMPGFGTTDRTYQNALNLMKALGVTLREISIRDAALQHFKDIGHDPAVHDVTYENTQARERTQILMDLSNQTNGLVVGTGDLSELALGWATYNGDHMSMYGVNAGIPKTLIRVLVNWIAHTDEVSAAASEILLDVLDTPVSPELLPPDADGKINQKTEDLVGPYELHDFFLYQILRFGFSPAKVLFLAEKAFLGTYDRDTLLKWLKNFYRRFFTQQFKRSCLPDGPKVGALCLSPRSDWRMPTDAYSRIWLDEVEKL